MNLLGRIQNNMVMFRRLLDILIVLPLFAVLVAGCSKTETTIQEKENKQKKTVLIGLIPERNIFEQMERYNPLATYLSEKTGTTIKLKILTRYGNIIDNFVSLGLDGAFLGSFTYTLAHAKLGVIPIARPVNNDGTSTYYGLIFARKDSGIKTAQDMKGKIFAFVDRATTAGYFLPLAYFRENGIEDYSSYLKETYFAGTHDNAIHDVLDGKADIGAAKNTIFYLLADTDKRITEDLVVIKRSPDVPQNGLAVRKDLDASIVDRLKEALLNMHNDENGRKVLRDFAARKFVETTDNDYKSVYKYIKKIGLNLATYEFIND